MHLLPGAHGSRHFEGASAAGRIRVRSADLAVAPAVVVASERMDEDQAWRKLEPGEFVYVDGNGDVHAEVVLKEPPAKPLLLEVSRPHLLRPAVAEAESRPGEITAPVRYFSTSTSTYQRVPA